MSAPVHPRSPGRNAGTRRPVFSCGLISQGGQPLRVAGSTAGRASGDDLPRQRSAAPGTRRRRGWLAELGVDTRFAATAGLPVGGRWDEHHVAGSGEGAPGEESGHGVAPGEPDRQRRHLNTIVPCLACASSSTYGARCRRGPASTSDRCPGHCRGGVAALTVFLDPGVFSAFGLPPTR